MQGPILNIPGLFISQKTLGTSFDLRSEAQSAVFEKLINQYGIILHRAAGGSYSGEGLATNSGLNFAVAPFTGIVKDIDGIVKSITVPTLDQSIDFSLLANGTYYVVAQVKKVYVEPGTITLTNGSKTVTGSGTAFTKRLGHGMQFVITTSGSGNDGVYEIDIVSNDTLATLKDTFTGTTEATLAFSAGGRFPDPSFLPATTVAYRLYEYESYEIVATQSAVAAHQLYICDVAKGTSDLTLTDKRVPFKFGYHTHINTDLSDATFAEEKTFLKRIVTTLTGTDEIEHSYSGGTAAQYPYHTDQVPSVNTWYHGIGKLTALVTTVGNYFGSFGGALATSNVIHEEGVVEGASTVGMRIVKLYLGLKSVVNGTLSFWNATNDFKTTIQSSTTTSDKLFTLPNESGTPSLTNHLHSGVYNAWRGFQAAPDNWPSNLVAGDVFSNAYGTFIFVANSPGTVGFTHGSKALDGSSTLFTSNLARFMSIVITASTGSNNGIYEVDTVTSDTVATLKSTYVGITESALAYMIVEQIGGATKRDKMYLHGSIGSTGFLVVDGYQTTQPLGFPLGRSGCVTALTYVDTAGNAVTLDMAYDVNGLNHFAAGSKLTAQAIADSKDVTTYLNNGVIDGLTEQAATKTVVLIIFEVTLD